MPKSSHRKKEGPSRAKRRLPVGRKQSKPKGGQDGREYQVSEITFTSNVDVADERKKQRLVTLSFCDLVSFDTRGKVNLMGCFDRIYADKETDQTGNFFLYVRTAGTRKGHVEVTFFDPNNKPVLQATYEIDIEESQVPLGKPVHAQFYGRIGFVAKLKGPYWVDVTLNGESLGGRDLTISGPEKEGDENERDNAK